LVGISIVIPIAKLIAPAVRRVVTPAAAAHHTFS
jgi:hypothetical protein